MFSLVSDGKLRCWNEILLQRTVILMFKNVWFWVCFMRFLVNRWLFSILLKGFKQLKRVSFTLKKGEKSFVMTFYFELKSHFFHKKNCCDNGKMHLSDEKWYFFQWEMVVFLRRKGGIFEEKRWLKLLEKSIKTSGKEYLC